MTPANGFLCRTIPHILYGFAWRIDSPQHASGVVVVISVESEPMYIISCMPPIIILIILRAVASLFTSDLIHRHRCEKKGKRNNNKHRTVTCRAAQNSCAPSSAPNVYTGTQLMHNCVRLAGKVGVVKSVETATYVRIGIGHSAANAIELRLGIRCPRPNTLEV